MSISEEPSVAVIGLGRIGAGIVRSLLRRGRRVRVLNRTAEKAAPLVAAGATQRSSSCATRASTLKTSSSTVGYLSRKTHRAAESHRLEAALCRLDWRTRTISAVWRLIPGTKAPTTPER